jgi:outer membrane immunogenic protein
MRSWLLVSTALAAVMCASAAQAADMRVKAVKAPVVAAPFSWSGFYLGVHAGVGWGRNQWSDFHDPIVANNNSVPGPDAVYKVNGAVAGGQIGFNWQVNWAVFGIEADASWAHIEGSGNNSPPFGVNCLQQDGGCQSKIDSLGTITGRFGVAFDRALVYVKGGAAWVNEDHTTGHTDLLFPAFSYSATTSETRWGWTIGGGAEFAVSPNWSGKIEYNYIDLRDEVIAFTFSPPQTFGAAGTLQRTLHILKLGVNYRFGGPAGY